MVSSTPVNRFGGGALVCSVTAGQTDGVRAALVRHTDEVRPTSILAAQLLDT